jgi:hypothetical protein
MFEIALQKLDNRILAELELPDRQETYYTVSKPIKLLNSVVRILQN